MLKSGNNDTIYVLIQLKEAKNLTNSKTDRQNILNNNFAISEIEKTCDLKGTLFEDKIAFTKEQIASFYEIDIRTVERYLEDNKEEFSENGYEVLKGIRLRKFIETYNNQGTDINVGTIPKATTVLGIFDFRTFLNMGMRTEEAFANTWNDIDLEKRIIKINKTVYEKRKIKKWKVAFRYN